MNAGEVGYICAAGFLSAGFAAGAVVIRGAVRELAGVIRDGAQNGYAATLSLSVKPPAPQRAEPVPAVPAAAEGRPSSVPAPVQAAA